MYAVNLQRTITYCFFIILFISTFILFVKQQKRNVNDQHDLSQNSLKSNLYMDDQSIGLRCSTSSRLNFTTILSKQLTKLNETFNYNEVSKAGALPSICVSTDQNDLLWSVHPNECEGDIFLIWLIKSSIYRNSLRKKIRTYWAQDINYYTNGKKFKTKRIFILGSGPQNTTTPSVSWENEIYDDILQGTFEDTFKSVTQKVVLGMKFVRNHCQSAYYIAVVDDDATVAPWNLFLHLPPISTLTNGDYFGGFFNPGSDPIRDKSNRWYISETEYRCKFYPVYPFGTGFFMSKCTLDQLYEAAIHLYLIGMDDVLFGGLAIELGIARCAMEISYYHGHCPSLYQAHQVANIKDIVLCHQSDYPNEQELMWSEFCHAPVSDPNVVQYKIQYCKSFL